MTRSIANSEEGNVYSRRWFEFFHVTIDQRRTAKEADFVCCCAPLPDFKEVLDVCCGMGRHARLLAQRGYLVTGIDRNDGAIAKAREFGGHAKFAVADIHDYQPAAETFDVAVVMGQSFGHFDAATNHNILLKLSGAIRKGGRIILDLWNPEFFATHQGERELKTARGIVREDKHVHADRLFVQLNYPDGNRERFEWQLFTPKQMTQLAESAGLVLLVACSDFDTALLPSPTNPRMQFVLERSP